MFIEFKTCNFINNYYIVEFFTYFITIFESLLILCSIIVSMAIIVRSIGGDINTQSNTNSFERS